MGFVKEIKTCRMKLNGFEEGRRVQSMLAHTTFGIGLFPTTVGRQLSELFSQMVINLKPLQILT